MMYAFCIVATIFFAGILTSKKILSENLSRVSVAILGLAIIVTALSLNGQLEQTNFRDSVAALLLPFAAWACFVVEVNQRYLVHIIRSYR